MTSPVRIDGELFAAAKAVGALMSRSAAQQLAHWARIGRALEAAGSVSQRDIAQVLEGAAGYDTLAAPEQAEVRAAWSGRIADRLADLDLAREFTAAGESFAELDEHGGSVRRRTA